MLFLSWEYFQNTEKWTIKVDERETPNWYKEKHIRAIQRAIAIRIKHMLLKPAYGKLSDLYGANLCDANLCDANLSYANLSYADLSGANLSYANLSYANLRYANLSYADLSGANLRYANLRYANLSGQDIEQLKKLGAII